MTYDVLRADIERWSGNTDSEFLASINRFINQAETKIAQLIEIPNYVFTGTLTCAIGVQTLSLSSLTPTFISVNDITRDGYGILEMKDTNFIKEAYPDSTEVGPPRYFSMQNNLLLLLGPVPDAAYVLPIEYFGKWPSLVTLGTNPSTATKETFISQYYETALLSGCMMYANMYMQDKDNVLMFRQELMENLGLIDQFGKGKAVKDKAEKDNSANSGELK